MTTEATTKAPTEITQSHIQKLKDELWQSIIRDNENRRILKEIQKRIERTPNRPMIVLDSEFRVLKNRIEKDNEDITTVALSAIRIIQSLLADSEGEAK